MPIKSREIGENHDKLIKNIVKPKINQNSWKCKKNFVEI